MRDFEIQGGMLVKYHGKAEQVKLPPGIRIIGKQAFCGCESLQRIVLPEGIWLVEEGAFRDCSHLRGAVLPESLRILGGDVFANCSSLQFLYLPTRVTEMPKELFQLPAESLVIAPGVPMNTICGHKRKLTALARFCLAQERGVVYRDAEGYRKYAGKQHDAEDLWCLALEKPSVLRYLLREKLLQLPDVDALLEKVQEGTETKALLLDYLQANFTETDRAAQEDRELEKVLTGSLSAAEAQKLWKYGTAADGSVCITGYKGKKTEVEIPRRIGRRAVTEVLLEEKPARWEAVTRLTIPKEIRQLGGLTGACRSDTEILVEEGSPRYRSEDGQLVDFVDGTLLFSQSHGETCLVLPEGIRHIGPCVFGHREELQEVVLPKSLETIGSFAFARCSALERIGLPEHVKSIGRSAFAHCQNLKHIALPEGLDRIEDGVFMNCSGLESVDLPEGLQSIGALAFFFCRRLHHMHLPAGLQQIGSYAFQECGFLQTDQSK